MKPSIDMEALTKCAFEMLRQNKRQFIALVGAPGSGKSTTAACLLDRLEQQAPGRSAVVAMDGFHYDDRVLDAMGRRARKGAPDTFDVGGLQSILQRLQARNEPTVAVPVFERDLELARGAACLISQEVDLIIVEGNYLLLQDPLWAGLHGMFDLTVMIDVAIEELQRRLWQRWQGYGLSKEDIHNKLEYNDLPNARLILNASSPADMRLRQEPPADDSDQFS